MTTINDSRMPRTRPRMNYSVVIVMIWQRPSKCNSFCFWNQIHEILNCIFSTTQKCMFSKWMIMVSKVSNKVGLWICCGKCYFVLMNIGVSFWVYVQCCTDLERYVERERKKRFPPTTNLQCGLNVLCSGAV